MGVPSLEDLNEQLREELRLEQEMLDHLIDSLPVLTIATCLNIDTHDLFYEDCVDEKEAVEVAVRAELKRVVKMSECCPTCGQAMKSGE